MPRTNLKEARERKHLSQQELADLIKSDRTSVVTWEAGTRKPQGHYCREIRRVLDNQDENLFKIDEVDAQQSHEIDEVQGSQPQEVDVTMDSSDSYTDIQESEEVIPMNPLRRNITTALVTAATLPITVNLQILTGPFITPEESLAQSRLAIADSWEDFNAGNFARVGRTLNAHTPTLLKLASSEWTHQEEAASLGIQGSIMQLLLANRKMDFTRRVFYCKEAIRFAKLSGNKDLIAVAREWHGNTYTVCYRQPETAKSILNKALKEMNSDSSPLVRSAIYSNLSIAHAQDKDENKKAENERLSLDYIEQARIAILQHSGLDPVSPYILWDLQKVEALAGTSYLHLAEHSDGDYALKAYNILEVATSKQAMNQDDSVATLTEKAKAALAIGDMRSFVDCLVEALPLFESKKRVVNAIAVVGRVPDKWKSEDKVQQLQKDLNHALIVVNQ